MEDTGVAAIDGKWERGVHFVVCQTLWWVSFYAMRDNEQISHTFRVGKLKADYYGYRKGGCDD